jgi:hypothetical protein
LQKTWLGAAEVQLGLAYRTVRCARPASGEQATLGKNRRCTTIIHRTVRWCIGLSGEPTVASAMVDRAIHGRRVACANGRQGAPDCPVCTGLSGVHRTLSGAPTALELQQSSALEKEGDRHWTIYSDCPVTHRTVWCTTRQKARIAFLVGLQRLLAASGLQKGPLGAWRKKPSLQETF